jgi:hypothetical protein
MRQLLFRLDADQLLDIGRRLPGKGNGQRGDDGRGNNEQRLSLFRLLLPQGEYQDAKDDG